VRILAQYTSAFVLAATVAAGAVPTSGFAAAAPPAVASPGGAATQPPVATAPPRPLQPTATPKPSLGPAPATAAPAPQMTRVLVRFAGQILDLRGGFVFFTTGDGFRLDPAVRNVDYTTGAPTKIVPHTGTWARASFDMGTISSRPIPPEAAYEDVRRFAVVASAPKPNPELVAKEGITGRPVLVTFTVLVPPTTQLSDTVYMQTDQSNWNPQAIRLDRIDALHYRITLRMPSGTTFLYRYTRGSTQSVEIGRNGLEVSPRLLFVKNLDAKNQDDTVYNWADANPSAPGAPGPNSIPTPYNPNPNPFPVPFPSRPTMPPPPKPHG
jgi:hypothetical protein